MKEKYENQIEAMDMVNRNGGTCMLSTKTVYAVNVGIGTYGAVDYLVNVHGWTHRLMQPPQRGK